MIRAGAKTVFHSCGGRNVPFAHFQTGNIVAHALSLRGESVSRIKWRAVVVRLLIILTMKELLTDVGTEVDGSHSVILQRRDNSHLLRLFLRTWINGMCPVTRCNEWDEVDVLRCA